MEKKNTPKEKEFKLLPKVIVDYFCCDGKKIAVLDNKAFKNLDKDALILANWIEGEKEDRLEALSEKEYAKAAKKYKLLVEAILEEKENEQDRL